MSYKLRKPYTEKQRVDFIVKYNHQEGLKIEEDDIALYALEPWENLAGGYVIHNCASYKAEQVQKERERLAMLSLTAADVERAIYKAKGIDFEDILEVVKNNPDIDLKALKIELKANNFYRGNPYIETIGAILGFTPDMLDEFFETGDYTKLIPLADSEVLNDD